MFPTLLLNGGDYMDRPTIDLLLPESKATVTLYQYVSHGQYKELQRQLIKGTKIDLSKLGDDKEKNAEILKDAVKDIDTEIALDQEMLLQKYLIKEVHLEDGAIVPDPILFVFNLTIADGNVLQAKLSEIEESSNLSAQGKKK